MELTDAERNRLVELIRNDAVKAYGENGKYHDERRRLKVPELTAQLLSPNGLGWCCGHRSESDRQLVHKFDELLPREVKEPIVDEALSIHK